MRLHRASLLLTGSVALLSLVGCTPRSVTAGIYSTPTSTVAVAPFRSPAPSEGPTPKTFPSSSPSCSIEVAVTYVSTMYPHIEKLTGNFSDMQFPKSVNPAAVIASTRIEISSLSSIDHPMCADAVYLAATSLASVILQNSLAIYSGDISFEVAAKTVDPLHSAFVAALSDFRDEVSEANSLAVAPVRVIDLQVGQYPFCASFSKDASLLALGGPAGQSGLTLFRPLTGETIGHLSLKGLCQNVGFSFGRQFILFVPYYATRPFPDYPLYVWDMSQMRPTRALDPESKAMPSTQFDLDSTLIVTLQGKEVQLYRLEDLPPLTEGAMPTNEPQPSPYAELSLPVIVPISDSAVVYSSRADLAAVATSRGRLAVVGGHTITEGMVFESPPTVYKPSFRPEPAIALSSPILSVAWGSELVQLSLARLPISDPLRLGGPLLSTYSLRFSPDGMTLFSGARGEVVVWDTRSGQARCRLRAGFNPIMAMSVDEETQTMYAISDHSELFSWHLPASCIP